MHVVMVEASPGAVVVPAGPCSGLACPGLPEEQVQLDVLRARRRSLPGVVVLRTVPDLRGLTARRSSGGLKRSAVVVGRVHRGLRRLLCGARSLLCLGGLVCAVARRRRRRIVVIAGRSSRCCRMRCWLVAGAEWRAERVISLLDIVVACVALDLWAWASRSYRDEELVSVVDETLAVAAVLVGAAC